MLVAVVSDTHGNRAGLGLLAERLKPLGVELVLHLGDDYRDLAVLEQAGFKVQGVPGMYCPEYADAAVPNRRVVELAGVKILLTHAGQCHRLDLPGDPDPERLASEVQIVLYGHSHIPALEEKDGVLWANPGHLRDRADKGYPPTFGLLRLSPQEVVMEILRLEDGEMILRGVYHPAL
ncbi:MAG: metallophosphoesterase family protein [Thermodesulfobacteriota bacterium]